MQTKFLALVLARRAQIGKAAGRQKPSGERPQPTQTTFFVEGRCYLTGWRKPGKRPAVMLRACNVKPSAGQREFSSTGTIFYFADAAIICWQASIVL